MNLDKLRASLAGNKTALGAAGAVAVGGLALLQARKRDSGGSPAAAAGGLPAPLATGGKPTYGYPVSYAAPDNSSSDVYNAIQPQIEYLQRLAEKQAEVAVPVPTPPPMTNQEWIKRATTAWAQMGRNPIDIGAALGQYVRGEGVNHAQTGGIGWAVREFGAAPEGTAGTSPVV